MKKIITIVCLLCAVSVFALDPESILRQADARRADGDSFRFSIAIENYEDGVLSDRALMSGNAKGMDKTMVQYDEPADMRGRKLLMTGDEMFIFMPRTRRPVRLTASQRLMGQASNGDVLNVRFQADYTPELTGEETVETAVGPVECLVLELTAKRKGTAYNRIVLYVDRDGFFPVQAAC